MLISACQTEVQFLQILDLVGKTQIVPGHSSEQIVGLTFDIQPHSDSHLHYLQNRTLWNSGKAKDTCHT